MDELTDKNKTTDSLRGSNRSFKGIKTYIKSTFDSDLYYFILIPTGVSLAIVVCLLTYNPVPNVPSESNPRLCGSNKGQFLCSLLAGFMTFVGVFLVGVFLEDEGDQLLVSERRSADVDDYSPDQPGGSNTDLSLG